jgi:hypothetical protein
MNMLRLFCFVFCFVAISWTRNLSPTWMFSGPSPRRFCLRSRLPFVKCRCFYLIGLSLRGSTALLVKRSVFIWTCSDVECYGTFCFQCPNDWWYLKTQIVDHRFEHVLSWMLMAWLQWDCLLERRVAHVCISLFIYMLWGFPCVGGGLEYL